MSVFTDSVCCGLAGIITEPRRRHHITGRLACCLLVVLVLLAGAMLGIVYVGNEVSKETHTKNAVITDLQGRPTQV